MFEGVPTFPVHQDFVINKFKVNIFYTAFAKEHKIGDEPKTNVTSL